LNTQFPQAGFNGKVYIAPGTQKMRASTGLELQVMLPVVNAPFRLYFAYNPSTVREYCSRPSWRTVRRFPTTPRFSTQSQPTARRIHSLRSGPCSASRLAGRSEESESKVFKRDVEDLNTDADEEQNKLFQQVWAKMQPVLQQYALQNGFAAVLDVGNEQSPVLWASNTVFITDDVVSLYNQGHPPAAVPAAAAPKPAAPAAKPPAPPAVKKP
jgi:hypothetical protein